MERRTREERGGGGKGGGGSGPLMAILRVARSSARALGGVVLVFCYLSFWCFLGGDEGKETGLRQDFALRCEALAGWGQDLGRDLKTRKNQQLS